MEWGGEGLSSPNHSLLESIWSDTSSINTGLTIHTSGGAESASTSGTASGSEIKTVTSLRNNSLSYPNLFFIRSKVLLPWLSRYPREDIFKGLTLYKPNYGDFADVRPKERFIRFRPPRENNLVLTMETYRHFLLIGLGLGQVLLYDLHSMSLIRTYEVNENFGVRQIIVGQKMNRFFVTAYDEFSEYSYYDSEVKFSFKNQSFIRTVLYASKPMLIVDIDGFVSYYKNDEPEIKAYPLGQLFGTVSHIEELKAYNSYTNDRPTLRPILLRHKCCFALINFDMGTEKVKIWKKDLLSVDPEEKIIIECFEEKMFYTSIPNDGTLKTSTIFVTQLKELGFVNSVEAISTTTGIVNTIRISEEYLTVSTREQFLEIFEVRSLVKKYVVFTRNYVYSTLVTKNILIFGTHEGSIIIQRFPIRGYEVCRRCRGKFKEKPEVQTRCFHFVLPEHIK